MRHVALRPRPPCLLLLCLPWGQYCLGHNSSSCLSPQVFPGGCHSWASASATVSGFYPHELIPRQEVRQQRGLEGARRAGFLEALHLSMTALGLKKHSLWRPCCSNVQNLLPKTRSELGMVVNASLSGRLLSYNPSPYPPPPTTHRDINM